MNLSQRARQLTPSATLATAQKAMELKKTGVDVISLTLGQPDFVTPINIQQAAILSIENGEASFYAPSNGIYPLRQAIIDRIETDHGYRYSLDEVVVSEGAKFGLYALFQVLLDKEDEVIIPVPYWVSYAEQVKLADGTPIFVEAKETNQFKVTVEDLENARTDKTKLVIINSPSNPTGMLYSKHELEAIGNWAVKHNVFIVADEIYGQLIYNGNEFTSMIELSDAIRKQTFIINGVSKSYAMTGWRIGYVLGDKEVIKAINTINSQSISNCGTVSQYAAVEALSGPQVSVETMRKSFEERLNTIYPLVEALPGVSIEKPKSAFYLYPNVRQTMTLCGYDNVTAFVDDLLEEAHVAVVSGEGFGTKDHIRISYATNIETIKKGVERIASFIEKKQK
ncbi:pyridoxal phosphate-dependent aminotransferase [Vagococcus xieshaowenii]|uniref:Aminotransferase n=1 Tax=Vagococcus xieshaowenii TaxID=2562451 RepID=A0AAJ5EDS4_9ENTE|nr:pyridoxal phosphate-dependent aminotransferase [Vagococcus xieshaowenii]QCA28621.1 pyridoxal phosphate-dependent aminotransferase [Vagococcus xieshaowenii]TFZ40571.1 pyridoxal phosphate-dependent aminotransferase [Vagococcus xieshaowenii]